RDPANLGPGWAGFDFQKAFGCPLRIINDAAMQALGSYRGGRMLFLGLGTGLGSALIIDGVLEPMELAHLPYKKGRTFEDYVGTRGVERPGKAHWRKCVADVVERLREVFAADDVVIGGGNARQLQKLPPGSPPRRQPQRFLRRPPAVARHTRHPWRESTQLSVATAPRTRSSTRIAGGAGRSDDFARKDPT